MTRRPPASAAATANVGLITWNDMSAATATGGRLARMLSCWATRVSVALAEMARPTQIAQAASSGMKTSSAGNWGACSTAVATADLAANCVIATKTPNIRYDTPTAGRKIAAAL